jgi:hypothetical protein
MTKTAKTTDPIAEALLATLISPNESDKNWEAANVVDGLFLIGRALHRIADALERRKVQWGDDTYRYFSKGPK